MQERIKLRSIKTLDVEDVEGIRAKYKDIVSDDFDLRMMRRPLNVQVISNAHARVVEVLRNLVEVQPQESPLWDASKWQAAVDEAREVLKGYAVDNSN